MQLVNTVGRFNLGRNTATADTAFVRLVQPFNTPKDGPFMYGLSGGIYNWSARPIPTITSIIYTTAATAHTITVLRPKNWTTVASDAAINQAVINITADPGSYSTVYKPTLPTGITKPANVGNNVIAGGDYCVYQLKDGAWVVDTVASVATLAITMTTVVPNITGGGVLAGAPFFFFGIVGDLDPATGLADPSTKSTASGARENLVNDTVFGGIGAFHPGDPLIVHSNNITNAGFLEGGCGYYAA